jgi:probable rRNA maturation factor
VFLNRGDYLNKIGIFNETNVSLSKELQEVQKLLKYALKYKNINNVEFNIIIVDNNNIKEINKQYRGKDIPTDVISFALEDYKTIEFEDITILGDIYISIEKAKEQALEYGHALLRELAFLSIHGLLHLLGYDHMNENEEKIMIELQEAILSGYGIKRSK